MKLKKLLLSLAMVAMLLPITALGLSSCSPANKDGANSGNDGTNPGNSQQTTPGDEESDTVKMKFFKAGRATCIVIRTKAGVVMIDAASDDADDQTKIATYLAEKGIKTVDYLIITNFSKKHIGGAPALLTGSGVTFKNVYVPGYAKGSKTYTAFANAMASVGLTMTRVTDNSTEIKLGGVSIKLYAPHKDYSTSDDENDEANSLAVSLTYGTKSFLMTSRITGERVSELVEDLNGRPFDLITVPNYGIYDSGYDNLFASLKATQAIAICSNNAEKNQMHTETLAALKNAGTTKVYATRDGSIEVQIDGSYVLVNGTEIALP